MSYKRVIPRDLFNESSLLKCLGRLYIKTENYAAVSFDHSGARFKIEQNSGDGSLSVTNVGFRIGRREYRLTRPLNSRGAWPLYLQMDDDEELTVFTDEGELSPEMIELIEKA